MADSIRAALERLVNAVDVYDATGMDVLDDAITAARAALSEERGEGPSADEWDALVARAWGEHALAEGYKGEQFMDSSDFGNALDLVRKELARWGYQPVPPAEGEVAELVAALGSRDRWTQLTDAQVDRVAELLGYVPMRLREERP